MRLKMYKYCYSNKGAIYAKGLLDQELRKKFRPAGHSRNACSKESGDFQKKKYDGIEVHKIAKKNEANTQPS